VYSVLLRCTLCTFNITELDGQSDTESVLVATDMDRNANTVLPELPITDHATQLITNTVCDAKCPNSGKTQKMLQLLRVAREVDSFSSSDICSRP
jgi:hypothetical protein